MHAPYKLYSESHAYVLIAPHSILKGAVAASSVEIEEVVSRWNDCVRWW